MKVVIITMIIVFVIVPILISVLLYALDTSLLDDAADIFYSKRNESQQENYYVDTRSKHDHILLYYECVWVWKTETDERSSIRGMGIRR